MAASKSNSHSWPDRRSGGSAGYRPEYCAIAKKMLADGASIAELAERFEVTIRTVREWQVKHDDFLTACMLGRGRRNRNVEQALFKAATGYDHYVEKSIKHKGEVVRIQCKEHVPPDVGAAIFWLTNRAPHDWSNTPEPKAADTPVTISDVLHQLAQEMIEQHRRWRRIMKAPKNSRTKRNSSGGGSQAYLPEYCAIAKKMFESTRNDFRCRG